MVQGCRTGTEGVYHAKLGYDVVGVDISKHQMKVAQIRFKRWKCVFHYILADMTKSPFRSNAFDLVLNINIAFGFFVNKETDRKVLIEAHRVLKPRGKFFGEFINIDYALSHPQGVIQIFQLQHRVKVHTITCK